MHKLKLTGSCSYEPNSTKATSCQVSYITIVQDDDDALVFYAADTLSIIFGILIRIRIGVDVI